MIAVRRTFSLLLVAVFFLLGVSTKVTMAKRKIHKGEGTAYSKPFRMNDTGKNACQFNAKKLPKRWQKYYAAMNEADWNKMGGNTGKRQICGRCIKVRGVRGHTTRNHKIKPVYVKIVDLCPKWACKEGNVDFSTLALEKITGYAWDRKKIEWKYTKCPKS